jgi:hypothetical protein
VQGRSSRGEAGKAGLGASMRSSNLIQWDSLKVFEAEQGCDGMCFRKGNQKPREVTG